MFRKDGRPAAKSVLKRYRAQKNRGTSGFGYIAIKDGEVVSYRRAESEHEIERLLLKEDAPEILFHHRWPTSTPNLAEQAHPLCIEQPGMFKYSYAIAHNGVITNTTALKETHEKLGITYATEMRHALMTREGKTYLTSGSRWNDSESVAIELALLLEGKHDNNRAIGAAAVIGIAVEGRKVVDRFCYRNSLNPLYYYEDRTLCQLTSLGKGETVGTAFLMQLQPGAKGLVIHPKEIVVPYEFTYSRSRAGYASGGDYAARALAPARQEPSSTTSSLERLGFVEGVKPLRSSVIERREEMIRKLDDDRLFAECERVTKVKKEVEQEVQNLRNSIANGNTTFNLTDQRIDAERRLFNIEGYLEALEQEALDRIALGSTPQGGWASD